MKIGYLHIGLPQHGICRYGRLLADEARRRGDLTVIEAEVNLTGNRQYNRDILIKAAQDLSSAEIIHVQFSRHNRQLWGDRWSQLYYLNIFTSNCSCPLVVTLHDVDYPSSSLKDLFKEVYYPLKTNELSELPKNKTILLLKRFISQMDKTLKFTKHLGRLIINPTILALRLIVNRASLVFVCTEEESLRLRDRIDKCKLKVIPHFVEMRSVKIPPVEPRKTLGLDGLKVVTVLGFINVSKGHQLVVEALSELPENVQIVFAGCASDKDDDFVDRLLALAKAKGVDSRLRITGYLSEEELESYLMATDLALCPFAKLSASSSLSSWISVARPILASDLPQIAEYNRLESDAIKTFAPYTPTALSKAIREILPSCTDKYDATVARLQEKLTISVIFEKHLLEYKYVIESS